MPLDTDGSSLRIWILWYGVLIPALTSAAVLLATWPLWRRVVEPEKGAWSAALALVAGFAAGQVGIEGWPPFPPREAADWLWNCTLAAVALSFLDAWRSCPFWLRWLVRAVLWLAVVWFLLPPDIRKEASRGVLLSWLVGLELAGLLYWALLALTARRLPGMVMPSILLIVSVGSVLVLNCGHISKLTLLASALAAALLPILARSAFRPPLAMVTAPVMTLLPGMWLRSYFYDYEPPPVTSLLPLAAAALSGVLALLPGIRKFVLWQRGLLCGLVAFALVAWAVILAYRSSRVLSGGWIQ